MPTSDSKPPLSSAMTIIGEDGVFHVIVVLPHVRDDESVVYETKCFCGEPIIGSHATEDDAKEAGKTHIAQIKPAPAQATYTSIIRQGLSTLRRSRPQ